MVTSAGRGSLGTVHELEQAKVERLAREIALALSEQRYLVADTADLASVERWHRAARRAGRILDRRVRTGFGRLWLGPCDRSGRDDRLKHVKPCWWLCEGCRRFTAELQDHPDSLVGESLCRCERAARVLDPIGH